MFGILNHLNEEAFTAKSLTKGIQREQTVEHLERRLRIEAWLKHPTAFWLHPEGPLSDTTPEEWLAKQKQVTAKTSGAQVVHLMPGEEMKFWFPY